jgi:RimJ/RimL family protein N-acetyltransferase
MQQKDLAVRLRATTREDLPRLYGFGLEPEALAVSGSKPRVWEEFERRWLEMMGDGRATSRVIVMQGENGDEVVGAVNVLVVEGEDALGYWIGREYWGRGIASAAVGLMLADVTRRPLFATAGASNVASLKVLKKHGFVEAWRGWTEETERTVARETVKMRLG